jgi:hypothetical protein
VTTTTGSLRAVLLLACLSFSTGLAGCGLTGGDSQSAFCSQLEQALSAYQTPPTPEALGPDAGASEWKAYFDVSRQRNAKLLAAAPSELTGALNSLQTANDRTAALYANTEYDPKQVDTGAVTQLLTDVGYQPAVEALTQHAQDSCHIDTDSISPSPN